MGIKFEHANGAVATIVEGWDAWQVTIERVDGSDERFNEKRYALATDSLAQRGYKPATVADSDADAMANGGRVMNARSLTNEEIADHARSLSNAELIQCWAQTYSDIAYIYEGEIAYREQEEPKTCAGCGSYVSVFGYKSEMGTEIMWCDGFFCFRKLACMPCAKTNVAEGGTILIPRNSKTKGATS